MFSTDDTIVAVATAAGHAGVGLVRVSGPAAADVGHGLARRSAPWPARRAVRASVAAADLTADALVTFFPGPASYTGDDVLEISAHGSPVILAAIVRQAIALGARPARPGEFTLRAFLRGKLDLVQAEAVRDLVAAVSPAQVRAATSQLDGSLSAAVVAQAEALRRIETLLEASMDFPDEGYRFIEPPEVHAALGRVGEEMTRLVAAGGRGQLVRDGARVVIAGVPNVGKSSVFNALVGADRAIVTPMAGTTRDLVSERLVIDGALVVLADTAGLRDGADVVEAEGVRRASRAVDTADVVIVVLDGSRAVSEPERALLRALEGRPVIVVRNKADLPCAWTVADAPTDALPVSAVEGDGVAALGRAIARSVAALSGGDGEAVVVTNERHRVLLARALEYVRHAATELSASGHHLPEEFVVADIRAALGALEEVTGRRTADELLHEIFAGFCIGK